jgi:hypothetical protein
MFIVVAERFLSGVVNEYGMHPVSAADGDGTWCLPQTCRFLKLDYHPYSFVYLYIRMKKALLKEQCNT